MPLHQVGVSVSRNVKLCRQPLGSALHTRPFTSKSIAGRHLTAYGVMHMRLIYGNYYDLPLHCKETSDREVNHTWECCSWMILRGGVACCVVNSTANKKTICCGHTDSCRLMPTSSTLAVIGWSCQRTLQLQEEKGAKDYTFWHECNEKPSIILGCPGTASRTVMPYALLMISASLPCLDIQLLSTVPVVTFSFLASSCSSVISSSTFISSSLLNWHSMWG